MRFSTALVAGLAFNLFASAMPVLGTFEAESNQLVRRVGHERRSETAGVQAYDQETKRGNTWTNELVAGAAAYAAMRDYENQVGGKLESLANARELIAGFASVEVDKLFEQNGLTYLDRATAKMQAQAQAEKALADAGYRG